MLRSFRFANHKSFRDEAELLLLPAYDKSRTVVPVAGVFGANASGKSSLLDALRWMQTAVRDSYSRWEPGAGVPRTPFRLDPDASTRSSVYCVELVVDELRYTYGLEVDDEQVIDEWLYAYPHNRRRVVFERKLDDVRLGSTVVDYRTRGEQLARLTRDNALFLSVAAHNALTEVQPIYEWFRAGLRFADGGEVAEEELLRRLTDDRERRSLVALVSAADLGITDVTARDALDHTSVEEELREVREALETLRDERRTLDEEWHSIRREEPRAVARMDDLLKRMEAHSARTDAVNMRAQQLITRYEQLTGRGRIVFHHGSSRVPLALEDQSMGTRSWIGLVSAALVTLGIGGLMVVDEIDASLHPHLVSKLINLFRDAETNAVGAQLLLTTHDATLLDEETLSRDEIWFVEKEPDSGATRLFPLTDFHPRKNEDTEGRYLAGGYGAVPVLSDSDFRRAMLADRDDDVAA
jgi:uncharacterized protein